MKYLITERQLHLLTEQDDWWKKSSYDKGVWDKSTKTLDNMGKLDPHTIATIFQIGTAFIPAVGPFISAAIGLADATLYYKEGDETSAGITAALSMIPFVGKLVSKIPGVKQLGSKGMATLGSKLSGGGKNLTKLETEVLNALSAEKNLVNSELNSASNILKSVGTTLDQLRINYISKFGQVKYDELLSSLLSKKIAPESFTKALQGGSSTVAGKITNNLVKVFRAGPKKSGMFFVSPSKSYVAQNYAKGGGEIYSMNLNLGKVLDLTKINANSLKIPQLLNYLKKLGVKFTKEETSQLLTKFASNKSTTFNKVYKEMPLWNFINSDNTFANAAKRSGFDSIKQFETSSLKGGNWDWSKGDISYFILNLIQ